MRRQWFREREPAVADGFGIPRAGQVPMRVSGAVPRVAPQERAGRSWAGSTLRLLRNALIGAVAMAVVPVTVVAVRGDFLAGVLYSSGSNARERVQVAAEPVRAFAVARDPSITPLQAGQALNELQYRRPPSPGFTSIVPAVRPVLPWRVAKLTPDMFRSSRSNLDNGPWSTTILDASVAGFSPRELAYLRELAESPVWQTFDLVARAPAVDMLGGQLRLPFDPDALPEQRPLPAYRVSKELAQAAVARAAYYMAIGQPREAEQVLRSIVSFGFAFIDNGTTTLDELIGTVIVGIGRNALQRFYVIEHDPRASLPKLAAPTKGSFRRVSAVARAHPSPDEVRRHLLAELADPTVPRPERFEAVRALSLVQCSSVRGLLFGQDDEVKRAIERSRDALARYPSERALIELQTRMPSVAAISAATSPMQSLFVSPATVAGVVLRNPRMAACTLLLTSGE